MPGWPPTSPYGRHLTCAQFKSSRHGPGLDRVVLRRVAAATVCRFVRRAEEAIADPAAATAPEAGILECGVRRFPMVAEEA